MLPSPVRHFHPGVVAEGPAALPWVAPPSARCQARSPSAPLGTCGPLSSVGTHAETKVSQGGQGGLCGKMIPRYHHRQGRANGVLQRLCDWSALWHGDRVVVCPYPSVQRAAAPRARAAPSGGQGGTTSHVFISFRCHPQGRPGHPPAHVGTHLQLGRLHERRRLRRHPQCPWQLSPHACSSLKTGRSPSKLKEPPKSSQELCSALAGSEAPLSEALPFASLGLQRFPKTPEWLIPVFRSPGAECPLPRAKRCWFIMVRSPSLLSRNQRGRLHLAPGEG